MAKKTKSTKKKTDDEESKPKIEFNLDDGVTWHDFAGLVLIIFVVIWKLLKIILYPVFWVYAQNVRMWRFIRADGQERVMNEDERLFFESVPIVFLSTGLIGGILVGLLITILVNQTLGTFINGLSTSFVDTILAPIGDFLGFLWKDVIIGLGTPVVDFIRSLYDSIKDLYNDDPTFALIILVGLGVLIVILWITINEKFGVSISQFLRKVYDVVFGTPQLMYSRVLNIYQKMNRTITEFLVGKQRLNTRTQEFFKKSLLYTVLLAVWTFLAGIYVGNTEFNKGQELVDKVVFSAVVLMIAGFICGTVIFALITRYFDLMNRRKYIAPEFIKETEKEPVT